MWPVMCKGSFPSSEKQGQNSASEQFCENHFNSMERTKRKPKPELEEKIHFVFGKL